ncbi:MAG TPA: SGNH/GDSL hydrolase family protein [Streptosporangiaceae bacterium]|jgi:lysophospholipase L1-like esterase
MTTFVALGDSITLGIGDPVRLPPRADHRGVLAGRSIPGRGREPKGPRGWRGWATLLADGLVDPTLHIVAGNGATMRELERDQLPAALQLRPDIASVVIGVNDTLRPNFDPDRFAAAAAHAVGALRAAGAEVLTMRLPDPGRMLGMPGVLARPIARRAHDINAVMDAVAGRFGTHHFDAATDPQVYEPEMWAVDRLHPSERGHRLIARRFHVLLAEAGYPVGPVPGAEPTSVPPSKAEQIAWLATKGTAWVLKRSTDLVPNLLAMAFEEWREGAQADPEMPGGGLVAIDSDPDLADAR